jgi:hypothetical protein
MAENRAKTIENGQTCLEKRGIDERHVEIDKNLYNNKDFSSQYSSSHPNATSEPDSVKGKGRNGQGHTHWKPYQESKKPKVSPNEIDYRNFLTTSVDGSTIGGKYDIETRDKLALMSTYERDINEYSVTNEDALSNGDVLGKGTGIELDTTNGGGGYDVIKRDELIRKNLYDNIDPNNNYSPTHDNAASTPNSIKGKSTKSGGHTYFMGYYGKPREDLNQINYSNFVTYDDGVTIGSSADIAARDEAYRARIYNRKNNVYSDKNKDALSNGDIIGKGTGLYLDTLNGGGGIDVRMRAEHLIQNAWRRDDLEYSRPLVLAEYDIQTEFKISTTAEKIEEAEQLAEQRKQEKEIKAAKKQKKKAEKRAKKEKAKADKKSGQPNVKPEPFLILDDPISIPQDPVTDYGYSRV